MSTGWYWQKWLIFLIFIPIFHYAFQSFCKILSKVWIFYLFIFKFNYSWLPITRTLANSNLALTRTKIVFPWIFFLTVTVILPSVTRTLNNSNFPLTRSNSHFYTSFTLDNSNHAISGWKKLCTEVRNIEFISKQPSQVFVFTHCSCHSSSNSVSFLYTLLLNCLSFPSISLFPYFRLFYFKLPISTSLEGSNYRESSVLARNRTIQRQFCLPICIIILIFVRS